MTMLKRAGWFASALALISTVGCNNASTEIPLAKVAPVTLGPAATPKGAPRGAYASPNVLPGAQ